MRSVLKQIHHKCDFSSPFKQSKNPSQTQGFMCCVPNCMSTPHPDCTNLKLWWDQYWSKTASWLDYICGTSSPFWTVCKSVTNVIFHQERTQQSFMTTIYMRHFFPTFNSLQCCQKSNLSSPSKQSKNHHKLIVHLPYINNPWFNHKLAHLSTVQDHGRPPIMFSLVDQLWLK